MDSAQISTRRTRRPDSLAAAVTELLDQFQCPVSTTAVRMILNDQGRTVTAEQLGRLAAYQREDFRRNRMPPVLCWALEPDGAPTKPRWWARGDWRLDRRIRTDDAIGIWLATLAEKLCMDLADRPDQRDPAFVSFTLGVVARVVGTSEFDVPLTRDDWLAIRARIYAPHLGAFSNRSGTTRLQQEAEQSLRGGDLSPLELLFGRTEAPEAAETADE